MTSIQSMLSPLSSPAYAALRVVAGALFMMHGLQKLFGLFGGRQVEYMSRPGAAGAIETVGGALIVVGLFTSVVAFIASGEMAFAYFLNHAPKGTWPIQNGGELAVIFCFLFLYLATRGGGRLSLDSMRR